MIVSRPLVLAPLAVLLLGAAPAPRLPAASGIDGDMASALEDRLSMPETQSAPVEQVRIEQRVMIRITPGPPLPPQIVFDIDQESPSRREPRRIGKCLAVAGIAAVQSARDNHLLLLMRDQRIVSATLEKACRGSEYYSGFYMARNSDGLLCLDRDILQSRSGAACKVKRWKELPN